MAKVADYHQYLFPLDDERLVPLRGMDARTFGEAVKHAPIPRMMIDGYEERIREPFCGITCDGHVETGLFDLRGEGAPTSEMVAAAKRLLAGLSPAERRQVAYPIDGDEWRRWSNPEFLINPNGLRLEDCSSETRSAVMAVLQASLSVRGLEKARGCMKTNAFLGLLCDLPKLMNEWSYNFLLFGEPSADRPWGWNLYGHHLALNCFVLGGQMVISPTFMGAEPNVIDTGPDAGLRLFDTEEAGGLSLMRSLSPALQARANLYRSRHDPALPEGRWHPADQFHLGGAFQDNRVIPYEGVRASEFSPSQRRQLMDVVEAFITYLPDGPKTARLAQFEGHLDRTFWSWVGGQGEEDPFYYRIQSPVLMLEFDHHSGVWLNNAEPAKCHIHTVVRTPNGNDYGKDLLKQHYQQIHPGHRPGEQ